jgi:hypothetical protein
VRILVRLLDNESKLNDVQDSYQKNYSLSILDHIDALKSKKNLVRIFNNLMAKLKNHLDFYHKNRKVWQFWKKNEFKDDIEIFIRGLKLLLGDEKWCFSNCDMTRKRLIVKEDNKKI